MLTPIAKYNYIKRDVITFVFRLRLALTWKKIVFFYYLTYFYYYSAYFWYYLLVLLYFLILFINLIVLF